VIFVSYTVINYFVKVGFLGLYYGIALFLIVIFSHLFLHLMQLLIIKGKKIEKALEIIKKNKYFRKRFFIMSLPIIVLYLITLIMFNISGRYIDLTSVFQTVCIALLLIYNSMNRIKFYEIIN
jgi:hypothetical protein